MPGFGDSAFIVILALLLFGPKKLPELARQFGKLMADFRRASNEFRNQMEEELRISEQADRQKKIAELEASAQVSALAPAIPEPEHPHLPDSTSIDPEASTYEHEPLPAAAGESDAPQEPSAAPLPIASSGELSILPPSTGLPIPSSTHTSSAPTPSAELETETLHG